MTWRGPWDALTEADRDALLPYLDQPMRVRDIARDLGWSNGRVYRVADKFGLPVRARPQPPLQDIAALVEGMRPIEAVNYLLEAYLNLSGEDREREMQLIADYGLSASQARIYAILEARAGQVVRYETLAMILEQAGSEADDMISIIKTHMCFLRRRIRKAGLPVVIEAVFGVGFCLRHQQTDRMGVGHAPNIIKEQGRHV